MYAKLKMELLVNDVQPIDDGFFRVYTQRMVLKKITQDKKKETEDFFTLKSEIDLSKHIGKVVTAVLAAPFSPNDNGNIYYRITGLETATNNKAA